MIKQRFTQSLYVTLGIIIVSVVTVIMALHSAYTYYETKKQIVREMELNSHQSAISLEKNMIDPMEAYAVNEYHKLILTEIERRDYFAILVEDRKMGEILGQEFLISGAIREENGQLTDFMALDPLQKKRLEECFYAYSHELSSNDGTLLGKITIYITDEQMLDQLAHQLRRDMIDTAVILLLLIMVLIITIKYYMIDPLSAIVESIRSVDEDGLPTQNIDIEAPSEISILAKTMNRMITTIKNSRKILEIQHERLSREQERFQLAIEGTLDGLWDWNLATDEVFHSPRFETMLGYEVGDLPNNIACWRDLLHPEDREQAEQHVKEYLEGKGQGIYENSFRMRTKDGSWRWIRGRGKAVFSKDGTPLRFLGFNSDITEDVQHQLELEHTAKHDLLTRLPNRFLFNELIQNMMHRCKRNNKLLALIYIDLDGFKEVNDTYGHETGDHVLITMSRRMQDTLRQEDIIARLGGDEFIIAISDLSFSSEAVPLLKRLLADLKKPVLYENHQGHHNLHLSASMGVTFYPQEQELGPEALLRQADQAMYDAKSSGKNQYRFFNIETNAFVKEHQKKVEAFGDAIKHDQLVLFYQPKVNMANDKVIGFEALLRWNHPDDGLLFPDSFLPFISQEKELMLQLGEWVCESVFSNLTYWIQSGHDFTVSINISAHEFRDQHLESLLQSLLERYPHVSPQNVELEVLETSALEDTLQAKAMIKACQDLGFKVALDDFGTGYSTLSYLKDLPVDIIKIDKSFVIDMLHDSASFSIIEAAMGLAEAFRCDVIAEGVESIEHGTMLMHLGCNVAQGYAIAKPMPFDQVLSWEKRYSGKSEWRHISPLKHKDRTILFSLVEHRQWLHMLEQHMQSPEENFVPELDSNRCRFGEWLNSDAVLMYPETDDLNGLKMLHTTLHRLAKEMVQSDDETKSKALFESLETHHQQIIDKMETLINKVD